VTLHNILFCHIDALTIFTAQIVHSRMNWGKICLHQWFSKWADSPPWGQFWEARGRTKQRGDRAEKQHNRGRKRSTTATNRSL